MGQRSADSPARATTPQPWILPHLISFLKSVPAGGAAANDLTTPLSSTTSPDNDWSTSSLARGLAGGESFSTFEPGGGCDCGGVGGVTGSSTLFMVSLSRLIGLGGDSVPCLGSGGGIGWSGTGVASASASASAFFAPLDPLVGLRLISPRRELSPWTKTGKVWDQVTNPSGGLSLDLKGLARMSVLRLRVAGERVSPRDDDRTEDGAAYLKFQYESWRMILPRSLLEVRAWSAVRA